MEKIIKVWAYTDIYNMADEFNRLDKYYTYVTKTYGKYFPYENENQEKEIRDIKFGKDIYSDDLWNIYDFVALGDYNKLKKNINKVLKLSSLSDNIKLDVDEETLNQNFDYKKANELEIALNESIKYVGNKEFQNHICGNSICGQMFKII